MIDGRLQWREVAILCGYGLGTCVTTATTVAVAIASSWRRSRPRKAEG